MKNKQTRYSRNGQTKKSVTSEYGKVDIQVSRDRLVEFEPAVVKKHQSNVTLIDNQIVCMYVKGMTTTDIQENEFIWDRCFPNPRQYNQQNHASCKGVAASPTVVFLDGIHFKVKQHGQIVNKAAYMLVAIDPEGHKEVLGDCRQ